jgi:Trk K+ transport system NAD-binding subunit
MKALAVILSSLTATLQRRNARVLGALLFVFVVLVTLYSTLFHVLMEREGQRHSWPTSVYWTLVTMTTLGFGDITFESDAGRIFSVVVLMSGTVFLLVLLPFTFIQFVFVPWMAAREAARAPREVDADVHGHLILTALGPIEDALVRRAELSGAPYVLLAGSREEAIRLHDAGYCVVAGELDDPAAYRAAGIERAGLVAATRTDPTNVNITFTVQELSPHVPIVATVSRSESLDILQLAGADEVLQLGEMTGFAMADRTLAPDGKSHVIGEFAGLLIAEARAASTSLVGKTLAEVQLRARFGVGIIGVWDKGRFEIAGPATTMRDSSVLILAAKREELDEYDRAYERGHYGMDAAVIVGGGRVGRAAGRRFAACGTTYRIVESRPDRIRDPDTYVLGDAAKIEVLEAAGIRTASGVILTTHDDDINTYLTIYCRRLRPDIRIVARANLERNVSTLYRAGADDVLSYASIGATAIWNLYRGNDTLVLADGLSVFREVVPTSLVGKTIATSGIRRNTGCNVVAAVERGVVNGNPPAETELREGMELVVIGDNESAQRFADRYGNHRRRRIQRREVPVSPMSPMLPSA